MGNFTLQFKINSTHLEHWTPHVHLETTKIFLSLS